MPKPTAKIRVKRDYGHRLVGEIMDHPRQSEFKAQYQATSLVVARHPDGTIETENTIYTVVP